MTRQPDTGESTRAITARGDDEAWPQIKTELVAGATLLRVSKLRRAYADKGGGPYGSGISDARVRRLERAGVLRYVGVDRYALAETSHGREHNGMPGDQLPAACAASADQAR